MDPKSNLRETAGKGLAANPTGMRRLSCNQDQAGACASATGVYGLYQIVSPSAIPSPVIQEPP